VDLNYCSHFLRKQSIALAPRFSGIFRIDRVSIKNSIINPYFKIYNQMAKPVDFPKYLQFLVESYREKQHLYTLTDLQVEVRVEMPPEEPPFPSENKPKTKIDRLEVLAGIRKYLQQGNVLLAGKPGSGKSTVLERFRWELAREALDEADRPIPVLVQLRSDRSILDAICAEFRRAKLRVSAEEVDDLLLDGKLLLLLDGVNEIPSQQRRQELQLFRDENSDTPMIFTTRDLALGGSLRIEKQLEMCALTEPQMRDFVSKYLPQHGDLLLQQLRDRLREIAETPLLLQMMCQVFENSGKIPQSKGELFVEFDRQYDKFKGGASVSDDFRRFKSDLLQQLAFVMLQGDSQRPTDGLVAISRDRAEGILECWLRDRGVLDAPTKAKEWLEDLLEHHLLQVAAKREEIEFHHQLFQEYYAGRALLKLLVERHIDATDDRRFKHFYLNYFKWTEPLAFMLSLLGDEDRAVRVVRLALDVDLMLGARLAGEVKREFQQPAVALVDGLDVPGWLKVTLLGEVRSDEAIPGLLTIIEDLEWEVLWRVAEALGKIGSNSAIPGLLKLVEDSDWDVRSSAADALGKIGSDSAIPGLLTLVKDSSHDVRSSAANALAKIGSEGAIQALLNLVEHSKSDVRISAAYALGKIGSEVVIPGLLKLLAEHSDYNVRSSAAYALAKIDSEAAILGLLEMLKYSDSDLRMMAADILVKIGSIAAIPGLIELSKNSDHNVRSIAADTLEKIIPEWESPRWLELSEDGEDSGFEVHRGAADAFKKNSSQVEIARLIKLLKYSDSDVRRSAADALAEIGDKAIPSLLKLIKSSDYDLGFIAADVLGQIASKEVIFGLLKLVKNCDKNVRYNVAYALREIGSEEVICALIKLVKDSEPCVREMAVDGLEEIGCDLVIPALIEIVEDSKMDVRDIAELLEEIGSEADFFGFLLELVENSDTGVRKIAEDVLAEIGHDVVIMALLKLIENLDSVCYIAANILVKIGSEEVIIGLLELVEDSYLDTEVHEIAVDVLVEIGSEEVIIGLLELVEDSDSGTKVRWSATNALCEIAKQYTEKVAPHLPHLLTLILCESGEEVHDIILAIQAACKYYNYPIRHLSLAPESCSHPVNASASVYIQSIEEFKLMSNQPPIFNQQNATISVNYAAENSNAKVIQKIEAAQQSSPEAALYAVVQIIQALEKKYTYVQDEQQALNIIDAEFKEIKEQKPIEWQSLISVKRLYNGGKKAALKVGEHFTESNPWGKGLVAFIEGVSEDVN
jgi:HEAT repeat protein